MYISQETATSRYACKTYSLGEVMEIWYIPSLSVCSMRMFLLLVYLFLLLIPFGFATVRLSNGSGARLSNATDQEALLGFLSAITNDPFQSLPTKRKSNVSICEWTIIRCSGHRVVALNVSGMGLEGTISPLLGNLSFLVKLDLSNNKFHGRIPYQLGNLFRLHDLILHVNHLQGSIPPTLGGCRSLTTLTLSGNYLRGSIPSELCVLSNLQNYDSGYNHLSGTIPACLGNMSSLVYINLQNNGLTGSIPSELCVLSNLQNYDSGYNHLSGTIPACLGNMSSLVYINLQNNGLTGRLPSDLCTLSFLRSFIVWNNSLTGQIPSSFSNCTNLRELILSNNHLSGHIPSELCTRHTQLMGLYLYGNHLSGSIPATLFNCTKLQVIEFGANQLSGVVPMELGKLTQLQRLRLTFNQLISGSTTSLPILTALTNCSSLRELVLYSNNLTGRLSSSIGLLSKNMSILNLGYNHLAGEIPTQIGNLNSLTYLDLAENHFTEAIPSSLNRLQRLERLYLGSNNLKGNIPMEIGELKSLGLLSVGGNNLTGRIPESVGNLQWLNYLNLRNNQLSGTIPATLGKCVKLLLLDLSYNRLSGHIPPEMGSLVNLAQGFVISNNLLEGTIPSGLSKMTMVLVVDLSCNALEGHIPASLGELNNLYSIDLSYNALEGFIPASLSKLQNLYSIKFSFNNLSGEIPISLEKLKTLSYLNFSFNKLSGEVPKEGVFKKINATAFMGNIRLCGPWVSLPPCSAHKHQRVWHIKIVIILIVVVAVIVVSCLLLVIFWNQNRKRHTLREIHTSLIAGHRRISYGEILTATNEFSDANLLGVGSFGKVYKGILNDGTLVAIKVLDLENEGAQKSFEKECKVLGKVRHRNLIRIITSYSDVQMKALIFPFMPNGSLEKWLYPDGEEESRLSLFERMNIGLDIAQGMAYLHHYCFMQVIHCDLKPSNILLGEDMTSYLIDFGIATICFPSSKDLALTSTHALKGSVGYIPPEYGLGGPVTIKGDVYSYGIVLLEMLTRKKPNHNMFVEGPSLQKWVGCNFPNRVGEVVDKSLLRRTSTSIEEVKELNCLMKLISVGLLCTRESPEERPTMINIVTALQSIKDTFLGIVGNPILQSDITSLLGNTSIAHNNTGESQSSSTF